MPGRLLPSGEQALLVEVDSLAAALDLHHRLWVLDRHADLADAVPGARSLLLVARTPSGLAQVRSVAEQALAAAESGEAAPQVASGEVVEVPVRYDGPDLTEVARLTGLTEREVVEAHSRRPWVVGFSGFAPGFAYLVDGDPRLQVPRRTTPRSRLPAGAVALAGEFSGIYPRASPGGWQVIGHTDATLWDLDRDPPALLRPGMRVRFVGAGNANVVGSGGAGREPAQPGPQGAGGARAGAAHAAGSAPPTRTAPAAGGQRRTGASGTRGDGTAYAELEVLEPGALTVVEDLGRPGLCAMGVGPSGAADVGAFALGARLLGQSTAEAALESHGGGLVLRARRSVTLALTGAPARAEVDGTPVGFAAPFLLRDGAVLSLGRPVRGVRTYVSVRGGVAVDPVLGSRSYDTLSGIGPQPLSRGAVLPVGTPTGQPSVDVAPVPALPAGPVTLELLPGPRLDWLESPRALDEASWRVDPASDRVGVRLDGPPLARATAFRGRELPSEGVVRGSVQLPADGHPVLFLADHPVTGGYPVVAVLTARSADAVAQLVPGQQVRLRMAASRPLRRRG